MPKTLLPPRPAAERPALPPGKVAGKKFVVTGKFNTKYASEAARSMIVSEGGKILDELTPEVDFILTRQSGGASVSAIEKKALKLNGQGANIAVIDEAQFIALMTLTLDEALALLRGGEEGVRRWQAIKPGAIAVPWPDLRGSDLRGLTVPAAVAGYVFGQGSLSGVNFQGASLSGQHLHDLDQANLDDATFAGGYVISFRNGTARRADLSGTGLRTVDGADFSGAKMVKAILRQGTGDDAVFADADLSNAYVSEGSFARASFARANLHAANLSKSDFTAADFSAAKLQQADLTRAKLIRANLTNADLRGADLSHADLTDAIIDGADLADACLIDARIETLDLKRAKNSDKAVLQRPATTGVHLGELDRVSGAGTGFEITVRIPLTDGYADTVINEWMVSAQIHQQTGHNHLHSRPTSASDGMLYLVRALKATSIDLGSLKTKLKGGTLGGKEFKQLALAAWCEACGIAPPTADDVKQQKRDKATLRDELVFLLRSGAKGEAKWNSTPKAQREKAGSFRGVDLADADLTAADLTNRDFSKGEFSRSKLSKAKLDSADFREATLAGANLEEATAWSAKLSDADLSRASLQKAELSYSTCKRTNFSGANLSGANLQCSDLCGADLTDATLNGVNLENARYDETTKWPAGFASFEKLKWVGKGTDPKIGALKTKRPQGPVDLETFLKRLEESFDKARLDKAISMLKADRFRLFAQVEPNSVVGVVKSQGDADLVYSCRLASDGSFSCCTQNLNVCGGLRGALCKHLLVLLIGLTKGGELDPTAVDEWVEASRLQKPALDKDLMSETFLRYKGAEAGEVDWRPTETIPEDYYSL